MPGYTDFGVVQTETASGSNLTVNLAQYAIGGVPGNVNGVLPAVPAAGGDRNIIFAIDNRAGTADCYLATPAIIAAASDPDPETETASGWVVPAGTLREFGSWSWERWQMVLRLLDGASVKISGAYAGQGF